MHGDFFHFTIKKICLTYDQGVSSWHNGKSARLWNRIKQVQTPVMLLRSLLDKYPWERSEAPYSSNYGLARKQQKK